VIMPLKGFDLTYTGFLLPQEKQEAAA